MKSPADQNVIQIELTNACVHQCSNCTRFCGHHSKPFFMEWPVFQKAVASMNGFKGTVGIMGGEPTLHPEFERFARHFGSNFGKPGPIKNASGPIVNFNNYVIQHLMRGESKRGLWSSLGKTYYKHFEVIQEVFDYQIVNDHINPGLHQALLVSRKELGVPDDEWIALRDNCWVQNYWSASITPKGAFFCEVAAALDMLFDGPGGWPIEPGWWRRTPADFTDQLHWCELCGAALRVPRRCANEEIDDVSPLLYEKLKAIGSPKLKRNRVQVFTGSASQIDTFVYDKEEACYLPEGDQTQRVGSPNALCPQRIDAIVMAWGKEASIERFMELNATCFDSIIVLGSDASANHCSDSPALKYLNMDFPENGDINVIMAAVKELCSSDWLVVVDVDIALASDFRKRLSSIIFNPGYLYYYGYRAVADLKTSSTTDMPAKVLACEMVPPSSRWGAFCYLYMFNRRASALRRVMDADGSVPVPQGHLADLWPQDHIIALYNDFDVEPVASATGILMTQQKSTLMRSHVLSDWQLLTRVFGSIALFGAGSHTQWLLKKIVETNLALPSIIIDDNPPVTRELSGIRVSKPEEMNIDNVDIIVLSTDAYIEQMSKRCTELWNNKKLIVDLYSAFEDPVFVKSMS